MSQMQVSNSHIAFNGWRTGSMYSFRDAARLAGVSTTTVKNWLFGHTVGNRHVKPLFQSDNSTMVSFLQMIEIMIAGRFRKSVSGRKRIPFKDVRIAYKNAQKIFALDYPFAHLRLRAISGHIIHELKGDITLATYQSLNVPEQWTMPGLLDKTIDELDYDEELVARWYPIGKTVPIVIDPRLSAGLPVIKGRGVTVQAIRNRFRAGLRIEFIAKDFAMDTDTVETALRYGDKVAA